MGRGEGPDQPGGVEGGQVLGRADSWGTRTDSQGEVCWGAAWGPARRSRRRRSRERRREGREKTVRSSWSRREVSRRM